MNKDPIILAMANPDPEIWPEEIDEYVAVMATGRSDYPNQVNNLIGFPYIFRGALDVRAKEINEEMTREFEVSRKTMTVELADQLTRIVERCMESNQ